eukprot:m.56908 g.56908  ORF g.56908 m.56908 type:complete len:445 (-) comp13697_c0_seq1:55-1389(-)
MGDSQGNLNLSKPLVTLLQPATVRHRLQLVKSFQTNSKFSFLDAAVTLTASDVLSQRLNSALNQTHAIPSRDGVALQHHPSQQELDEAEQELARDADKCRRQARPARDGPSYLHYPIVLETQAMYSLAHQQYKTELPLAHPEQPVPSRSDLIIDRSVVRLLNAELQFWVSRRLWDAFALRNTRLRYSTHKEGAVTEMDIRAALALAKSRGRPCQLVSTDVKRRKRTEPPSALLQHELKRVDVVSEKDEVVSSDDDSVTFAQRHQDELDDMATALFQPADHVLRNWGMGVDRDLKRAGATTERVGRSGSDTDTDDLAGMVVESRPKRRKRKAKPPKPKAAAKRASSKAKAPKTKKPKRTVTTTDNDDDDDDNDDDGNSQLRMTLGNESAMDTAASSRPQRRRQSVANTSGVSDLDLKELDSQLSSSLEEPSDPDDVWRPGVAEEL